MGHFMLFSTVYAASGSVKKFDSAVDSVIMLPKAARVNINEVCYQYFIKHAALPNIHLTELKQTRFS